MNLWNLMYNVQHTSLTLNACFIIFFLFSIFFWFSILGTILLRNMYWNMLQCNHLYAMVDIDVKITIINYSLCIHIQSLITPRIRHQFWTCVCGFGFWIESNIFESKQLIAKFFFFSNSKSNHPCRTDDDFYLWLHHMLK